MSPANCALFVTLAVFGCHGAALANPAEAAAREWNSAPGYRLAARPFDPVPANAASLEADDRPLDPARYLKREPFGPSWSYQAGADGPVFAVESLGSSRKGRPKLVHLALDWDF